MMGQMRKALAGCRLLSAVLCATAMSFVVALGVFAQEATVHIEPPSTEVGSDAGPFTVSAVVDGVTNLGAFQFDLSYDPAVLKFVEVQQGLFLGSTGREVRCLAPRTADGSLTFSCVTLGATPDGPNGSGVLATITFQPLTQGSSALHLARLILTDPSAQPLPAQVEDATITAFAPGGSGGGGFAWALWGPVIGVGALALGAAAVWTAWRVRWRRSA
jgi:hypothetical protein